MPDLARARALELPTDYEAPPGDPLVHQAAGLAKVMASAVFVSGLDAEFAWRSTGFFTCPPEARARLGKPVVDRAAETVRVTVPDGPTRIARRFAGQGFITLPLGAEAVAFTPLTIQPRPAPQDWPRPPNGIDRARLAEALAAAFEPAEQMTAAFVALWKGAILAERYGEGVGAETPLESWSMGKSLAATLMGILIGRGAFALDEPAPIAEWRGRGDPRGAIRIRDLLNMASGLRSRAPLDPGFDPAGPYPDHLYLYTGGGDSAAWAASRPLQWPPGTVGRYRNTDPVLVSRLIRQASGEDYFAFPWRSLFDPLGIASFTLDADPTGTFLLQGYEQASARDWARLGQLHLQMGRWRGEAILPEAFCRFCRTLAPAWTSDANPVYGGFFWVNGDGALPAPKDAFFMAGAGGQRCLIVPSHELVIVRLGHFAGSEAGLAGFARAVGLLLQAVPRSD